MEFVDLDRYPKNDFLTYGGAAGTKFAVTIDGEPWIVKFPENTKGFEGKHVMSYTTSPISEYIGSHIYGTLGIPVHETMLGKRDGKVVVACRDFTAGARLHAFADIKNTLPDFAFEGSVGSSGRGEYLSDALTVIDRAPLMRACEGTLDRFWDMFVVDAFIRNGDRNNGNWGVLTDAGKARLAPVFDNGNSLFSKRTASVAARRSQDDGIENDLDAGASFYLSSEGDHIHPFDYIAEAGDPDCEAALGRFLDRIDLHAVESIIDSIPSHALGLEVLPDAMKAFYKEYLSSAYKERLMPAGAGISARRAVPSPPTPSPSISDREKHR